MKNLFAGLLAAALLLPGAPARAQTAAPGAVPLVGPGVGTTYRGPRFPGGPDSLRALVAHATGLATPRPVGRALVQFELKNGQQPYNFQLVSPPGRPQPELAKATAAALFYLQAHMPSWQPGTADPGAAPGTEPKVSLVLDFTTAPAAQPYQYADQSPVFPDLAALLLAQQNPFYSRMLGSDAQRARLQSVPNGLTQYAQMQTRYPPQAIRNREQGQVYAYFEVAENGAIEHPELMSTAGNALDAEVRRVMQTLPAATAPALLQGRPVRVFYVLPLTFRVL